MLKTHELRRIDAEVALEVMCWPTTHNHSVRQTGQTAWSEPVFIYQDGPGKGVNWVAPQFSEGMEPALLILNKMRAQGWGVEISNENEWLVKFQWFGGRHFSATAPTLPLAIALASLKATRWGKDAAEQSEGA